MGKQSGDLNAIAQAIIEKQLRDPLYFYRPHKKQRLFHESRSHKNLYLGGNGSGKSYAGCVEFALAATGRHWVKDKYPPPPLDMRICAEKPALIGDGTFGDTIIPVLRRLLRNDLEPGYPKKGGNSYESVWKLRCGTTFDIMVFEQDVDKFESVSKHVIWFDEPFPEAIYKASIARMRKGKGGVMNFTLTPLVGAAWMYERFIAPQEKEDDEDDATVVYAEIWDNCKCLTPDEHDGDDYPIDADGHCGCNGGYIHRKAIERQIAEYDEEERDARERGMFIILRDKAFTGFEPNVHIIEQITPDEARAREMQLYMVLDAHPRKPPAVGIYGIDPDGTRYVLDEFPNYFDGMYRGVFYNSIKNWNLGYEDTVRLLNSIETKWGGVRERIIDPRHGSSRLQNTGRLVMDELRHVAGELGIDMKFVKPFVGSDTGEGQIASGIHLIRDSLHFNQGVDVGIGNSPALYVCNGCANHIRMFQYLRYNTLAGKATESKGLVETLQEKYKEFFDTLHYWYKRVKGYVQPVVHTTTDYVYRPRNSLTGY